MIDPQTYWDTFDSPYQMGPQKHRVYLLDLLKAKDVQSILDVGCGTGPIYELIKISGGKWDFGYKGTDYSPAMIEVCQKQFLEGDFEVEDARKLTEPNSSWDCVLLMHCLDHLDDYKAAIAEAARVAERYVLIVLWRPFVADGVRLNDRNMYGKKEGEEPWKDTHLQEYSHDVLFEEFTKNNLSVEQEVEGEVINEPGKYNWLVLLKK